MVTSRLAISPSLNSYRLGTPCTKISFGEMHKDLGKFINPMPEG